MKKSAAHQSKAGWRKSLVLCAGTIFLVTPFLLPVHHLPTTVAMVFAIVSAPFIDGGYSEIGDKKIGIPQNSPEEGQLYDDDHHKTPTPVDNPKDTSTPQDVPTPEDTSTPEDEHENSPKTTEQMPTQTPIKVSPTGTPQPPNNSSSGVTHSLATPRLSRSGPVFPQSTPTRSTTQQLTITLSPSPIPSAPSETDVPTSTPHPAGGGIITKFIPEAPIVRKLLPYELLAALFLAYVFFMIYGVWSNKR
jgi:hypothetical protein